MKIFWQNILVYNAKFPKWILNVLKIFKKKKNFVYNNKLALYFNTTYSLGIYYLFTGSCQTLIYNELINGFNEVK
jgi:hypothetical protein